MTLIMPNTPFYRTAENCGTFYDSIYVPNYTPYNYSLPAETEDGFRYFMAVYGHEDGTAYLNYDILDQFDSAIIVNTIIKGNGRIEAYNNFGLDDVDFGNKTYQLVLVKGKLEDEDIKDVTLLEVIGCVSFISEIQCKSKIKITYELYCGYEYKFNYYLKGHLNRQPAISDENISFLGTNGQPNVLFSITHLPMMLTTSVMGWREQTFLEQILNKNNFMINGNSVNKADGAIFTVRNSATKGLIGSILLIASTIVFNACCKEYEALPQNYRVDNISLIPNTVSITMAEEYETNDSGAWIGSEGEGIKFYWGDSFVNLTPSDIQDISTDSGSFWILSGSDLAITIRNLVQSSPSLLNPQIELIGNTLNITIPDGIDNLGINFNNGARLSPLLSEYFSYETDANHLIYTNNTDRITLEAYFGEYLKFFVKINDIWVEKTNEVFNGSWKVLNTTDNVTEWKITQSDGTTVVQSGQVIAF